jgi:uncharacterized membrane protein YdbT with pleckstrin-like domain
MAKSPTEGSGANPFRKPTPKPYVEARLLPGERVVYRPNLAPLSMIASPIFFAFLAIVTLFIAPLLSLLLLPVVVVAVAVQRLRYLNTEFSLTDRCILVKVGWLSHRSSEVLPSKVESINVVQGLDGRIFGYGSIAVTGTGGSHEVLAGIDKPFEFYRHLQEQLASVKAEGRPT